MCKLLPALLVLLLSACASQPRLGVNEALLDDRLFAAPQPPIQAAQALELSPAMQKFLDDEYRGGLQSRDPQAWLIQAFGREDQLALRYDSTITRNAAEAFETRSGNCLSLALMTGAIARAIGLPVRYQSVFMPENWSRSGGIGFASGHVNVALGSQPALGSRIPDGSDPPVTIDFLPPEELRGQRTRALREETVLAMYLNNRAAEWMAQAKLDEAYAWAKAAIHQDPSFISSYNTLGVIYLRNGNLREAERSLRYVLKLEPENTVAMSNLVQTLAQLGETRASQTLAARLATIDPHPPFHFFDQGVAAMRRGDYAEAKQLFAREVRRAAYHHEFHFWLALANLGLGDPERARKHLGIALENSTSPREHALYAGKLDWLNQRRIQ